MTGSFVACMQTLLSTAKESQDDRKLSFLKSQWKVKSGHRLAVLEFANLHRVSEHLHVWMKYQSKLGLVQNSNSLQTICKHLSLKHTQNKLMVYKKLLPTYPGCQPLSRKKFLSWESLVPRLLTAKGSSRIHL